MVVTFDGELNFVDFDIEKLVKKVSNNRNRMGVLCSGLVCLEEDNLVKYIF